MDANTYNDVKEGDIFTIELTLILSNGSYQINDQRITHVNQTNLAKSKGGSSNKVMKLSKINKRNTRQIYNKTLSKRSKILEV